MKNERNSEVLLAELKKTAAARSDATAKAQRIRDAEAAVIAAAERVVEGWHYVNHGKQLEPSRIEREADLTTAVRALLEARNP